VILFELIKEDKDGEYKIFYLSRNRKHGQ